MQAKIILFRKDKKSFISKCIARITGSDITHSAVYWMGDLWDSSEKRGRFDRAKMDKLKDRTVEVYPYGASKEQIILWLMRHNGKKYDYKGILGWVVYWLFGRYISNVRVNSKNRVYCFEATANLISIVNNLKFPRHVSGDNLKRTLGNPQFVGTLENYMNEVKGGD